MLEVSRSDVCMKRINTCTEETGVTISGFWGNSQIRSKDISNLAAKFGIHLFIYKETMVVII